MTVVLEAEEEMADPAVGVVTGAAVPNITR